VKRFIYLIAALAFLLMPAHADNYPSKPIRIVLGYAPGGGTDVHARFLAEEMSKRLGQRVVVENRPGATGTTAGNYVSRRPPDGYTLYMSDQGSMTIAPLLLDTKPFDMLEDFDAVSLLIRAPLQLYINPNFPAKTFKELVELAKAHPGKYSYATAGIGSSTHLMVELLAQRVGIELRHVPYPGAGPAALDVISGVVPLWSTSVSAAQPHMESGAILPMVNSSDGRFFALPDVPTFTEEGYDFTTYYYNALVAPKGTPKEILDKLHGTIADLYKDDQYTARIRKMAMEPFLLGPKEAAEYIRKDIDRFKDVIMKSKNSK